MLNNEGRAAWGATGGRGSRPQPPGSLQRTLPPGIQVLQH